MLRFLRVFGQIAVTAWAEELHCSALRTQRSKARNLSDSIIFSMVYPKFFLARFPIGHTLVIERFNSVTIWDQATELSQPDIVRWKLNFVSVCFGRRQSPSRISCKSQRFLGSMFSLDKWSALSYSACSSEHVFFSSSSRTSKEPSFWCEQAEAKSRTRKANRELRFIDFKTASPSFPR